MCDETFHYETIYLNNKKDVIIPKSYDEITLKGISICERTISYVQKLEIFIGNICVSDIPLEIITLFSEKKIYKKRSLFVFNGDLINMNKFPIRSLRFQSLTVRLSGLKLDSSTTTIRKSILIFELGTLKKRNCEILECLFVNSFFYFSEVNSCCFRAGNVQDPSQIVIFSDVEFNPFLTFQNYKTNLITSIESKDIVPGCIRSDWTKEHHVALFSSLNKIFDENIIKIIEGFLSKKCVWVINLNLDYSRYDITIKTIKGFKNARIYFKIINTLILNDIMYNV